MFLVVPRSLTREAFISTTMKCLVSSYFVKISDNILMVFKAVKNQVLAATL